MFLYSSPKGLYICICRTQKFPTQILKKQQHLQFPKRTYLPVPSPEATTCLFPQASFNQLLQVFSQFGDAHRKNPQLINFLSFQTNGMTGSLERTVSISILEWHLQRPCKLILKDALACMGRGFESLKPRRKWMIAIHPPKTNMEPKNWWFVKCFSFSKGPFSGSSRYFSGGVIDAANYEQNLWF